MRFNFSVARAARRFARSERGTQLVELAIVLPILLVLFATVAEFGRFFYTYTTLSKATRSAARYLTTAPANGANDAKAQNLAVYGNTEGTGDPLVSGLSAANIEITREGGVPAIPERVTVEVQGFTYDPIFDIGGLIGNSAASLAINVSPSTTMRYLSTLPV